MMLSKIKQQKLCKQNLCKACFERTRETGNFLFFIFYIIYNIYAVVVFLSTSLIAINAL